MFSGKTVFFLQLLTYLFKLSFWSFDTNKAFKIKFVFVHFTYSYFQMFSLSSAAFASTGNYKVSKYQWIKMSSWLCFILHRLYFQGIQRVQIKKTLYSSSPFVFSGNTTCPDKRLSPPNRRRDFDKKWNLLRLNDRHQQDKQSLKTSI